MKGQKSRTDNKGNRVFMVYLIKGEQKNPLYKNNNERKELKIFKGKSPKEVGKKVVTEVCRLLKKENPKYYKQVCRPVTEKEMTDRDKILKELDADSEWDKVDVSKYPGFQFELVDMMNVTSDGLKRSYMYYGERIKLEMPKKFKGKKFDYESQVIPMRKDYNFQQALIDHVTKSKLARKRYSKTKNFEKHRKRSLSKKKSK